MHPVCVYLISISLLRLSVMLSVTVAIDVGFSFGRLCRVVLIGICNSVVCFFFFFNSSLSRCIYVVFFYSRSSCRCFVFIYVLRFVLFSFLVAHSKISTEVVHKIVGIECKMWKDKVNLRMHTVLSIILYYIYIYMSTYIF